jgi:hypothetical protein
MTVRGKNVAKDGVIVGRKGDGAHVARQPRPPRPGAAPL